MHHYPVAIPTYQHTAECELDIARTIAGNLHRARTEAQLVARIASALACCETAAQAARIGGLENVARMAKELAEQISAAITHPAADLAA